MVTFPVPEASYFYSDCRSLGEGQFTREASPRPRRRGGAVSRSNPCCTLVVFTQGFLPLWWEAGGKGHSLTFWVSLSLSSLYELGERAPLLAVVLGAGG